MPKFIFCEKSKNYLLKYFKMSYAEIFTQNDKC